MTIGLSSPQPQFTISILIPRSKGLAFSFQSAFIRQFCFDRILIQTKILTYKSKNQDIWLKCLDSQNIHRNKTFHLKFPFDQPFISSPTPQREKHLNFTPKPLTLLLSFKLRKREQCLQQIQKHTTFNSERVETNISLSWDNSQFNSNTQARFKISTVP